MKKTFVFVMNIPSPYRIHLLDAMWRQLKERGLDMQVHFMAKGHKDRPKSWLNPKIDFPHTYWRDYGFGEFHFNPGLILHILRNTPDYLVCGSSFDTFTGIGIMMLSRAAIKMCWLEGNTKTPGRMTGIIGWFKRFIMSRCKYAPVPGMDAAKYVEMHRALAKGNMPKPVILPNLVDERRFAHCEGTDMSIDGCDDKVLCLVPARLEPVKGLIPFLNELTPDILSGWRIVIMGQGSLRHEIDQTITSRGLSDCVKIVDYVPYDEMPKWYARSDLVLLPSLYDPNPLTCVEALHSGKALALSCMAGNVEEAVTDGRNGWVLPVNDQDAFAAKLKEVFSTPKSRLAEMGEMSKNENSQFWNTKKAIARFLDETLG